MRYELSGYIPEDGIHSHRRENVKCHMGERSYTVYALWRRIAQRDVSRNSVVYGIGLIIDDSYLQLLVHPLGDRCHDGGLTVVT
jgi:hypothetical protein